MSFSERSVFVCWNVHFERLMIKGWLIQTWQSSKPLGIKTSEPSTHMYGAVDGKHREKTLSCTPGEVLVKSHRETSVFRSCCFIFNVWRIIYVRYTLIVIIRKDMINKLSQNTCSLRSSEYFIHAKYRTWHLFGFKLWQKINKIFKLL